MYRRNLSLIIAVILIVVGRAFASTDKTKTKFNPFTSKLDYVLDVTELTSNITTSGNITTGNCYYFLDTTTGFCYENSTDTLTLTINNHVVQTWYSEGPAGPAADTYLFLAGNGLYLNGNGLQLPGGAVAAGNNIAINGNQLQIEGVNLQL